MSVKHNIQTPELLTLIEIAKEWAKERKKPYQFILKELFTSFWQGHFDDKAYFLVSNAKTPKDTIEAEKNGLKINRELMITRLLFTGYDYWPDEVKDDSTTLEEKYSAMEPLYPDEYHSQLVTMQRITISENVFKHWVKKSTKFSCDFWPARTGRREIVRKIRKVLEAAEKMVKESEATNDSNIPKIPQIAKTLSKNISLGYGAEAIKKILTDNYPAAHKYGFTGFDDYLKGKNT